VPLLALLSCGPPEEPRLELPAPPEPTAADLLLVGDAAAARAYSAGLEPETPAAVYAAAQLAVHDGDYAAAAELLSGLDDRRARFQVVHLAVAGLLDVRPAELPPPGAEAILELGYGLALLNGGWESEGLARLAPLDTGAVGCLAQLIRSRRLDPVADARERRAALERAWVLATPLLRRLVIDDYLALLDELGAGEGTAVGLREERTAVETGTPLWDDLTYWLGLLAGPQERRELAWELADAETDDENARRRALELLSYDEVPADELARTAALALELDQPATAAELVDRLPAGPTAGLLRGELEYARGRFGLALAQYENLFDDADLGGLARLYAGSTQYERDRTSEAAGLWAAVEPADVPAALAGSYLERDAALAEAKAAYYRANLLRYSAPAAAAALYHRALAGGVTGKERARAGWRAGMIEAAAGNYIRAAEALASTDHDPAYAPHAVYWVERLAGLAAGAEPPRLTHWSYPFYELPGGGGEWWLYREPDGDLVPWGGLFEGCYSTFADPELTLLLELASAADDELYDAYREALLRYREREPLAWSAATLAEVRRRMEVGDYSPPPGLYFAGRALAETGEGRLGGLAALPFAYPPAHLAATTAACAESGLDPLLLLALVREESRFDPDCVSRAGAVGLTQQMPATAALTADRLGLEDYDPRNPADSLRLGAAYLAEMLERYDDNLMLALAGYNAGPGNADRWRAAFAESPPDIWLLTVPFDETRRYITRVLGSYLRYRQLYRRGSR
jgi:hypothetical protein